MLTVTEVEKHSWAFRWDDKYQAADKELDKAIDAWEAGLCERAEEILKRLLLQCPFHIDALHHLAVFYSQVDLTAEAYMAAQSAVSIGIQSLPLEFQWGKSRLEWGCWDNRPFLRAMHLLALIYRDLGQLDSTIDLFNKLLSVNPSDNQGVRYLLPSCYFEKGDPWLVVKHCRQHSDDSSPEISYSYALGLVMIGEQAMASKVLKEAVEHYPLVAKELLKKRHTRPKGMRPGLVSHGGADQAHLYWQACGKFWEATPAAMDLLKV